MPMSDVIGCHKSPCPVAPLDECITQLAHHFTWIRSFIGKKMQNSFFWSGFRIFFDFLSWYHLPCICNSLEPEPVILQYLLHFGTVTLHFAWYLLHLAMFAFHFAWYLLHFGMVTWHFAWYLLHLTMCAFHFACYCHILALQPHLNGICKFLVRQTFMWVSWGFL